ncbi:MAG: hypothetical protein Q3994_06030, partial [Prevotella sp.]|nr:hypothetical protein [Prevotella sp.]
MSEYSFSMPKYRAIQEATIVNKGITVIAGENGSGKSTISRALYCMVNIMSNFASYVFLETKREVEQITSPLVAAMGQTTKDLNRRSTIRTKHTQLLKATSLEDLEERFQSMLNDYEPILVKFFTDADITQRNRILGYLEVEWLETPEETANACIQNTLGKFNETMAEAQKKIDAHGKNVLFEYVRTYGVDMSD